MNVAGWLAKHPSAWFALACVLTITIEGSFVFVDRNDTFSIHGREAYDVTAFAQGGVVAHAFLMRGEGLHAVSVRLASNLAASATVQWTLWRGIPDAPQNMTRAFEAVETIHLKPGRQWKTVKFARDGSSHDRWYTIELRLLDARPPPSPQIAVVASHDNPDRGGALWVSGVHQPGASLFIRADRRGRTLYRRFLAEAAPNLPGILQEPLVQWAVVLVVHWALIVFAYAILAEGWVWPTPPITA